MSEREKKLVEQLKTSKKDLDVEVPEKELESVSGGLEPVKDVCACLCGSGSGCGGGGGG